MPPPFRPAVSPPRPLHAHENNKTTTVGVHLSVFSHRLHWLLSLPPSIWCAAVLTPQRKPSGNRSLSAPVSRWCHFQYSGLLRALEAVSSDTARKQTADQAASARDYSRNTCVQAITFF